MANEIPGLLALERGVDPLTAGQLRAYLARFPDEQVVVLSRDAEGNGHSPLAFGYEADYVPDSTYSGEVYATAQQAQAGVADAESTTDDPSAVRVLVLGPTN